ncbi:MAG: winged helix DNA-binding protein, partial [Oscillospiraceae bacterium]
GRIAKAMAHLEKKGFICRVINENNKREKLVRLTERGHVMVKIFNGILDEWKGICYVGFSDEERECYLGFLKRISDNVLANRKGEK